ncbi:hypothetical protein [Quadrisphaera sp. DSM 44207]|uniref:hypothetical protein n=1 Tax=Quadrisphaera sp. DSM 44207 TaxID=1881057 RepID=UPI0021018EE2|nr:hypothetical protein [Quadrisphaera sp. DSM 44207]
MHTITAVENVSLDEVMQSPGRPDEDTRDGFDLGGWASARLTADPQAAQASMRGQGSTAALLLGRRPTPTCSATGCPRPSRTPSPTS